MNIHKLHS